MALVLYWDHVHKIRTFHGFKTDGPSVHPSPSPRTSPFFMTSIHEAARDDKPQTVAALIAGDPKLATALDEDARSPLHWACTMQHIDIVRLLLPHIGDIDDVLDAAGWTPVHIAAALGNNELLGMLMAHDPKPDVNVATTSGVTAVHLAVSKGHTETVTMLINKFGCSVRVKDKMGRTALHRAAACGSQPMVRELVEAKAMVNATDRDGWTALHHALAEGHGDVAVLLVLLGADAEARNTAGETPAEVASEQVRVFFTRAING